MPIIFKDDSEKRSKDIQNIYQLDLNQSAKFFTYNIKSWKTYFYEHLREKNFEAALNCGNPNDKEIFVPRKFTFKKASKLDNNNYIVTRLQ